MFLSFCWQMSYSSCIKMYQQQTSFYFSFQGIYIMTNKRLNPNESCPVGWSRRIQRLHLCRGVRPLPQPYDAKNSDSEDLVMLELWGMRSISSLLSLPGSLWVRVVAPDGVLSMVQIEVNCVFTLHCIAWNRTVFTLLSFFCTYATLNCLH